MSKRINVNPDHYKVAGRDRQGENIVQSVQKQAFAQQQAEAERWQAKRHERLPAWEETPGPVEPEPEKKPSRRPAATRARTKKTSASRKTAKTRRAPQKSAKRSAPKKPGSRR